MATKSDEFQMRLLAMFRVEAKEHLEQMTAGLLELEKTPTAERQMTLVENVFREVHSLKGAARSVKMTEVEALCQSLEKNRLCRLEARRVGSVSRALRRAPPRRGWSETVGGDER